jgi:hypothetical protein
LTASERVFDTGGMGRDGAASALADLAARVQPTMLAREQCLPVLPALEPLLPGAGLRRGATVSVDGPAATSLALAAAAGPSQDGAWVAAVGFPSLGLLAAAELGVALDRLVLVADPGGDDEGAAWPAVVAALVDAFEVVLVHAQQRVGAADGRRLAARARERGAVLVQVGASRSTASTWPEGADVALTVVDAAWEGLGEGHGHLRARRVTVEGGGRRDASRPRRAELWLPAADGAVDAVLPDPVPLRTAPRVAETA